MFDRVFNVYNTKFTIIGFILINNIFLIFCLKKMYKNLMKKVHYIHVINPVILPSFFKKLQK